MVRVGDRNGYGGDWVRWIGDWGSEGTDRMARGSCKLPDHAGLFGYLSTFVGGSSICCVCV